MTNAEKLAANSQMDCTPIDSTDQLRPASPCQRFLFLRPFIVYRIKEKNAMADLAAGSKRRRPHVIVIAAERVAARWAQALAAERVMCLVADDLTVAAR